MANDPTHRSLHTHRPDEVSVRENDEDGMMEIRLPIASTGDVRNDGDEPLTTAELRGMAEQLNANTVGVFPEHGQSDKIDFAGYSQFEKLGYWSDADVEREASADDEDLLMATARMPDPEPLPSQTGTYREALAILKEQAVRGIPITSSIGWREDDAAPGGNDLLEVSIVGIGADPRTATEGGQALVARAAVEAGADPEALVKTVQAAVRETRPLGPPGDRDRFDTFEECVATLSDDDDVSEADAEQICGAWENASDADDPEDTHDMTADDTSEESDTTDEEQTADADGEETETRAADDVTLQDFADLLAPSLADADADDLMDAWADFEYTGAANLDAVAGFVSTVTDADMDATENALDDLMDGEQAEDEDDEEEDEDEDEEQSADTEDDEGRALDERLDAIEDDLAAIRSGEVAIETPDPEADAEQSADADDDADTDDTTEQRDTDPDTDPADKPAWAV